MCAHVRVRVCMCVCVCRTQHLHDTETAVGLASPAREQPLLFVGPSTSPESRPSLLLAGRFSQPHHPVHPLCSFLRSE